jgi:hypothetical protein
MIAQPKRPVLLSDTIALSRSKKFSRPESSLKMVLRSIPLMMICCRAPGASMRALRGVQINYNIIYYM